MTGKAGHPMARKKLAAPSEPLALAPARPGEDKAITPLTAEGVYGQYMLQCACAVLPDSEDYGQFCAFRDILFFDLAPANAIEGFLVDRLVALLWRQRRAGEIERRLFARVLSRKQADFASGLTHDISNTHNMHWLMQYEAQLDRSIARVLRELRLLQAARRGRPPALDTLALPTDSAGAEPPEA